MIDNHNGIPNCYKHTSTAMTRGKTGKWSCHKCDALIRLKLFDEKYCEKRDGKQAADA